MDFVRIGTLVEHRTWGRGKVLALSGQNVQAYFPSLTTDTDGPFRLVREVVLTIAATQTDPVLDLITGLPKPKKPKKAKAAEEEAHGGPSSGSAVTARPRKRLAHDLERAIHWFEQEYPGGFSNEVLVRTEIKDKRDAHQLFVDSLAEGRGRTLLESGRSAEAGILLDTLYRATRIPSRFEINASHDGLKVPEAGAKLLDALLGFLDSAGPATFQRLADAVASLPVPAEGSRVLTWPNVTILPFLADPSRFMVSKPEIFRQIGARMDADLSSSTTVKWDSYARVLELSKRLQERLAPLGATDFIDVQTFVWVTRQLS